MANFTGKTETSKIKTIATAVSIGVGIAAGIAAGVVAGIYLFPLLLPLMAVSIAMPLICAPAGFAFLGIGAGVVSEGGNSMTGALSIIFGLGMLGAAFAFGWPILTGILGVLAAGAIAGLALGAAAYCFSNFLFENQVDLDVSKSKPAQPDEGSNVIQRQHSKRSPNNSHPDNCVSTVFSSPILTRAGTHSKHQQPMDLNIQTVATNNF